MVTDASLRTRDDAGAFVSGTADLVLVGHGSQIAPRSARPVHDHAETLRERQRFADVHTAFLKQEPGLAPAIRAADREHVVVAPLLMSRGYYSDEVIPSAVEEVRPSVDADVRCTDPVGTHPTTADVILERAEEATGDADVEALVVAGHGAEGRPTSGATIQRHVERIRERDVYDEVVAAFLEGEPALDGVTARLDADHVAVVPAFVADGHHCRFDVPDQVGFTGDSGYVDGVEVSYADPVGTHPRMAEVVIDCVREAGIAMTSTVPTRAVSALLQEVGRHGGPDDIEVRTTDDGYELAVNGGTVAFPSRQELCRIASLNPEPVTNWYYWTNVVGHLAPHERAFLRWLEWAEALPVGERYETLRDGFRRQWGELSIETTITAQGDRRYEIRHVADQGRAIDTLDRLDDVVADARSIAGTDESRNYRPARSARTLPTGWIFTELGPSDAVAVVDDIYPASVSDWYRARTDDLERSHVADLADRPGGFPGVDRDVVEGVVAACCEDEVCVRRRLWGYDAATAPDADIDDAIPCAAPCPHAASVARRAAAADDPGDLERPDTGCGQLDRSVERYARHAEGGEAR